MRSLFIVFIFLLFAQNTGAKSRRIDSLNQVLKVTNFDTVKVHCYNNLCDAYIEIDSAKAMSFALQAIRLSEKIVFDKGLIKGLYNLAYCYEYYYRYPEAEQYYLIGINRSRMVKILSLEAFGLNDYALVLKKQNKHQEALEINLQAMAIYTQLLDTNHMASSFTNIGNNYKNLNQFEKAVKFHLKALNIAQLSQNHKGIARAYNNIGLVYDRSNDYEQSLKNYLLMLPEAEKSGVQEYVASAYGNIGSSYQNLKQTDKAIPYMLQALKIHETSSNKTEIALTLNNLAEAYIVQKKFDDALKVSVRAIGVAKEASDIESEAYAYLSGGKAYQGIGRTGLAKEYLLKAETFLNTVNSSAYSLSVFNALSTLYAEQGNHKLALDFHIKLLALQDSVYDIEKHKQITTLQMQYETVNREKALAQSESTNLKKTIQIQQKNNWLALSFLGAMGLLIAIFLIVRNASLRQQKLKQEKELAAAKGIQILQEEKLRISRELHDNIGAQLTFINSSLQNLSASNDEEMQQTKAMTLHTIQELRSIVWLINKESFFVDELVIKLRDLLKPLQNRKPTIEILCEGNEELKLNASIASNVFRIIQEATNNALKYAQANALHILVDSSNNKLLIIKIKDDGIGFDPNEVKYSFGLKNIESRANSLNGKFELKSKKGSGTELIIIIPLT